jgi:hypothetical protein
MRFVANWMAVVLLGVAANAAAFESDVHFGLTKWLAVQAGFSDDAAGIIGTGDQRVDSGDMQFIELVLVYACAGSDSLGQRFAGEHHYPSAGPAAGPPEQRSVEPGSPKAVKDATALLSTPLDKSPYMLLLLGGALHTLQDSWSHQGVPGVPRPGEGLVCDPSKAWAHPQARGGWDSHRADITMYWGADVAAMAKATYDILVKYPMPARSKQPAKAWDAIAPELDKFIRASTKTDKKAWFAAHGIGDVTFLEGISLPDGAEPFTATWEGRKLPPLPSTDSNQHETDPELLAFYGAFFKQWMSSDDFAATAVAFGTAAPVRPGKRPVPDAELAARLKAWRVRDHGRIADVAHSKAPLSAKQRAAIDAAAKTGSALAHYDAPADAFFPLLPRGKSASPLLPFYVRVDNSTAGKPRAVAITKLRHAPYDALAVTAERVGAKWHIVSILSTVDH